MTLHFVIKTKHIATSRKPSRSDSTRVPVYVRIKDGKDMDQTVRTEILVNPLWWDKRLEELSMSSKCPDEEKVQTNEALSELRGHIINDYLKDKRNHRVNHDWLRRELSRAGFTQRREDITDLFRQYCEEKKLSAVRSASYDALGRALRNFESYRRNFEDTGFTLDLGTMDSSTLNSFQEYLSMESLLYDQHREFYRALGFNRHPRPRSKNTIIDLLKKFRAFYRWHSLKEHTDGLLFNDFKVSREIYGTPVCLTKEELTAIREAGMPSVRLEEARDIFVFQCNVGCRVGDLMRLTRSNVSNGELSYIPSKSSNCSGRRVLVPLNAVARAILEKYDGACGEMLLPFCTVHQYNSSIKRILRLSGVDRQVTVLDPLTRKERQVPIYVVASSHMARRSFINNLYGRVKDSELVASLTGHVEGSQSFFRYREIGTDIKRDLVALLE